MQTFKKHIVMMFKYSDTHLYEFSLACIMLFLNPPHLLALRSCDAMNSASILLLMIGSVICGLAFGFGVVYQRLEIRFQMARFYWVYTVFTLLSLAPCGFGYEWGLVVSFALQFISSAFLLWRLGTERDYRLNREQSQKGDSTS
tara:strand:- start:7294 stop:7725 length:432 start_codon:yes stop_codon:yes gene_type:complete